MATAKVLRCSICGLPFARLDGDVLIIESKHHGEKHTNIVKLKETERTQKS